MLNLLKIIRYFVFVVFVICNAVITSVAVWNLSIIEILALDLTATHIDAFLIFVGASGLLLVFTIIFFELYGKNVFLGRVWFELAWTGAFCVMELVGAAATTARSTSQTCDPSPGDSPCASNQVLQAFTWILAILLLGYLTILSVLTLVKRKDDPTIWHCSVRRFPLMTSQTLKSVPNSPTRPGFIGQVPIIVAPTPRRIPIAREAILSYRSGLSLEYEIEHYRSEEGHAVGENPTYHGSADTALPHSSQLTSQAEQTTAFSPFYHTSVQLAIGDQPNQMQAPPPAHLSQIRQLPVSSPPALLGDWPRLDATARPRTKRKPLPQLENTPSNFQLQPQSQSLPRRQSRPLPPPQPLVSSSSYTFDAPALTAALQPIASQSLRSKPSGPRRKLNSIDGGRPADLDLSNIRSPGFS